MIIDSSVMIAIFDVEPETDWFIQVLVDTEDLHMSAASYLEVSLVVDDTQRDIFSNLLDNAIESFGITIEPVTATQARLARRAHRAFGRKSGSPARLNFGDCFTYALSVEMNEPLLFKGGDFNHTDVRIDERSVITGKQRS